MTVIAIKLGFALAFTMLMVVIYWALEKKPQFFRAIRPEHVLLLGIALRLLLFVTAFVVLKVPFNSDIMPYRYDFAKAIYDGNLPYQGVDSDFAPLFPYLFLPAITSDLHTSLLGIAFIVTLLDIASFALLWYLMRQTQEMSVHLRWSLLYVFCPLPYLSAVIGQQDETWLLGIYALSFLLLVSQSRFRAVISGSVIALGGVFTKVTTGLPIGLILGFTPFPHFLLLGMVIVGLVFLPFFVQIFPAMMTSLTTPTWPDNPSVWYLVQVFVGDRKWLDNHPQLFFISAIVTLLVGFVCGYFIRFMHKPTQLERVRFVLYAWILIWLSFSLITPKGIVDYTLFWVPLVPFLLATHRSWFLLGIISLFCIIAGPHTSLSYRILPPERYTDLRDLNQMFMLVLDSFMYLTYIIFAWHVARRFYEEFHLATRLPAEQLPYVPM